MKLIVYLILHDIFVLASLVHIPYINNRYLQNKHIYETLRINTHDERCAMKHKTMSPHNIFSSSSTLVEEKCDYGLGLSSQES